MISPETATASKPTTNSAAAHEGDAGLRKIERALLSVTDKTGLVEFARALAGHGVELVSTGGTAKALRDAGLDVRDISDLTGFPEMLDGRVKTLHPKVHGGILHMRDNPEHVAAVQEHAIQPIDMVVVNLYAFEKTAVEPGVAFSDVIENIDIGGPSMVRSAAKNFEDVAIVTAAADYAAIAEEMAANSGALSRATRWRLAKAAFATTAAYDAGIAIDAREYCRARSAWRGGGVRSRCDARSFADCRNPARAVLRYGENPHQQAALYVDGSGRGIAGARQLQGKELSYNNLVDLDACWELVSEFDRAGGGDHQAHQPVRRGDGCDGARGLSARAGGRSGVGVRRRDRHQSRGGWRGGRGDREAVCGGDRRAGVYSRRRWRVSPRRRTCGCWRSQPASGESRVVLKQISGGFLVQDADRHRRDRRRTLKVVTKRAPTAEEMRALRFAWSVCKHVKSNAIVYARSDGGHGQTVGVGAGQMSRVDAAKFGAMKAVLPLAGTVAASDAFFPFPDGLEAVADGRRDGGDSAGRLGARRGGDRGGEPAGHGDGVHRDAALPARVIS